MKILVLGAGKMGSWFVESLCLDYDVAVFDKDKSKLRYFFNAFRFVSLEEIKEYNPDLVINAVSLQLTTKAFDEVLPYLSKDCILSDITSVKNGLKEYYAHTGFRYASSHPMFGPTFANVKQLENESAVIIRESDEEGKKFFRQFYKSLSLRIFEYSFEEHDQTTAYSLSVPFSSTMVFASCMKKQDAPGTTFKKHMDIARGLFSEDDYLLAEILFNPYTLEQVESIHKKLDYLIELIKKRDFEKLKAFFEELRENIQEDK